MKAKKTSLDLKIAETGMARGTNLRIKHSAATAFHTIHTVQYTLYTLYNVHCTPHSAQYTLLSHYVQCIAVDTTQRTY